LECGGATEWSLLLCIENQFRTCGTNNENDKTEIIKT